MSEFVKIDSSELVKYQNISYDRKKIVRKMEKVVHQKDVDDTSIYEYDYECLKKKGLMDQNCHEFQRRDK